MEAENSRPISSVALRNRRFSRGLRFAYIASKLIVLSSTFLLVACGEEHDARSDYAFLKGQHASPLKLCAAARRVEDAVIKSHDETKYLIAHIDAQMECATAELLPY